MAKRRKDTDDEASPGPSTIDSILNVINNGKNYAVNSAKYLYNNSDTIPDKVNGSYEVFKDHASTAVVQINDFGYKVRNHPERLTFFQTLVLFIVVIITASILLQQLSVFYEEHLPEFQQGLIKFLTFFVIPVAAALGTLFGMHLENRYQMYFDVMDRLNELYGFLSEVAYKLKKLTIKGLRAIGVNV